MANNSEFIALADAIMISVLNDDFSKTLQSDILNNLKEITFKPQNSMNITEIIDLYRSKFRENIGIETIKMLQADFLSGQAIGHYVHQKVRSNLNVGKIGALVKIHSKSNNNMEIVEEIANALARQAVALDDAKLNISSLLNSEYLFSSVGKVSEFINMKESIINSKISVLDLSYIKIK